MKDLFEHESAECKLAIAQQKSAGKKSAGQKEIRKPPPEGGDRHPDLLLSTSNWMEGKGERQEGFRGGGGKRGNSALRN